MTNDFGGKVAASGGDGGGVGGGGGGGGINQSTAKSIYSMTFYELESEVRKILGEELVSMKMTDFLNHIWMFDQSRTTPGRYTLPPGLSDKTVHEVCQATWNENGGESIASGSSSSSYLQSHQSVGDVFFQAGIVWEELSMVYGMGGDEAIYDEWRLDDIITVGEGSGGLEFHQAGFMIDEGEGSDGLEFHQAGFMIDEGGGIGCDGAISDRDKIGNQVQTEEERKKSKLEKRRKYDHIRRAKEKANKREREATIEALTETNRKLMVENQQLREQIRGIEELEAYKRELEENVRKFKEEEDRKFQAKKSKIEKHQKKGGTK